VQERGAVAPLSGRQPRRLLLAGAVGAAVVAADQVTKSLAQADLRQPVHLFGPFGLSLGYNSGSAFSLFTGDSGVLAVVAAVLVVGLAWLAWRAPSAAVAAAVGLVLGGAVGNLCDRAFRGHHGDVVDFVTLTHWPTFNVADASVTVGLVLLVVLYWRAPAGGSR
jgi:signal peptidase II